MYQLTSNLIIYRNDNIIKNLSDIFRIYNSGNYDKINLISSIYTQINKLLTISYEYGFNNNLWHNYLAFILVMDENPFTLISEKNIEEECSLKEFVINDLKIFKKLFDYDFSNIEKELQINCFSKIQNYNVKSNNKKIFNKDVTIKIQKLSEDLSKVDNINDFYNILTYFYQQYGVGNLGLYRAFKISHNDKLLTPISSIDEVILDDIVGYKTQKNKLIKNTEAFVKGKRANNILLYGDAGTGKSTSIKAILNQYYEDGLRVIEVYKHETKYLPKIINKIKNRNYRFILYMDDLSFEESESEYKYLKALIEGGIGAKPNNIVIYATSNRRHIIRETWNERINMNKNHEMYESDTIDEKLSLVNRFGITIRYYKPSVKEYHNMVLTKAKKHPEIKLNEDELINIANNWLMNHAGPSGRTAEQLIIHLIATTN